jgi:hypothetical protein
MGDSKFTTSHAHVAPAPSPVNGFQKKPHSRGRLCHMSLAFNECLKNPNSGLLTYQKTNPVRLRRSQATAPNLTIRPLAGGYFVAQSEKAGMPDNRIRFTFVLYCATLKA